MSKRYKPVDGFDTVEGLVLGEDGICFIDDPTTCIKRRKSDGDVVTTVAGTDVLEVGSADVEVTGNSTLTLDGATATYPSVSAKTAGDTLQLSSFEGVDVVLDANNDGTTEEFRVQHNADDGAGTTLFTVSESGDVTVASGDLVVPDGALATPSIHGADTDSGMAFASNQVSMSAGGGTAYVNVNSDFLEVNMVGTGRLDMNLDSATYTSINAANTLELAADADMHFVVDDNNNSTSNAFSFKHNNVLGAGTDLFTIAESGDVTVVSGDLVVPNGTAAAPSIHGSAVDDGIYFATDEVGLTTVGTERLSVDAAAVSTALPVNIQSTTDIDNYDESSFTVTWDTEVHSFKVVKLNDTCTLMWDFLDDSAATITMSATAVVPAGFRPVVSTIMPVRLEDNSTIAFGVIDVQSDGDMRFFNAAGGSTTFTNRIRLWSGSVTYTVSSF